MKVADCVLADVVLPDARYEGMWESIVAAEPTKERLLRQVLLGLRLRQDLPFAVTALHGLVLMYGPPGTGKMTLGRGVAVQVARMVPGERARLVEIDPHGLMSAEHGQSQQRVTELLVEYVPLLADDGMPTVVLLDEVESMAVARSAASLSANPADVHRATDAVLTAMDRLTLEHPHVITVATSNFVGSLDEAFRSRADAAIEVPLPSVTAITQILRHVLHEFGAAYPGIGHLAEDARVERLAAKMAGLDGRRVRKVITEALARRTDTVLDPSALTMADLMAAASDATIAQTEASVRAAV
ncbi:MAG: AAA family ATPase [Pseudonocardiaceae bacterium]